MWTNLILLLWNTLDLAILETLVEDQARAYSQSSRCLSKRNHHYWVAPSSNQPFLWALFLHLDLNQCCFTILPFLATWFSTRHKFFSDTHKLNQGSTFYFPSLLFLYQWFNAQLELLWMFEWSSVPSSSYYLQILLNWFLLSSKILSPSCGV